MKIIYFLQNYVDFVEFINYAKNQSVHFETSVYIPSDSEYNCHSSRTYIYYISSNKNCTMTGEMQHADMNCMKFCTSYQIDAYWHLGRIALYEPATDDTKSLYKTLIMYMKKQYFLSSDKMFYIGPGMYEDWQNYKINYMSSLFYQKLTISANQFDFEQFREIFSGKGYIIKGDGVDIRKPHDESFVEGYVIFSDGCRMFKRIAARKEYYTSNSQCVFLNKNRDKYNFIVDNRLLFMQEVPVINLYQEIENYLEEI